MNKPVNVKVVNLSSNPLPQYAHDEDAGLDLMANLNGMSDDKLKGHGCGWDDTEKRIILFSGGRCLIPTGLHMQLPKGYYLSIVPRSGLALKQGISILNTPGTIDSNYTGDIGVILINLSEEPIEIYHGAKIAQAILQKYEKINFKAIESLCELETTDRGENGFGSTGI